MSDSVYMGVTDAAKFVGAGATSLYVAVATGKLAGERVAGRLIFAQDELERFKATFANRLKRGRPARPAQDAEA